MKRVYIAFLATMMVAGCGERVKKNVDSSQAAATREQAAETTASAGAAQANEDQFPSIPSREEGERFLAENAKRTGVRLTASGLQYEVLKEGTGRRPKATERVSCYYEGRFISGDVFDSSYRHGEGPLTFSLDRVIAGWAEGLQLMKVGAKYRFFIPYHLAYGAEGAPGVVPPYSTLIFDVELVGVR